MPSQNTHSGRSLSREDLFVELEQDHKIVHLMATTNKERKKKKSTACLPTIVQFYYPIVQRAKQLSVS